MGQDVTDTLIPARSKSVASSLGPSQPSGSDAPVCLRWKPVVPPYPEEPSPTVLVP